jgi:hypothetical protein
LQAQQYLSFNTNIIFSLQAEQNLSSYTNRIFP